MPASLSIGRVRGHRGTAGEITTVVASGKPERWLAIDSVLMDDGSGGEPVEYEVEGSRAYKDRLILKLKGVDEPRTAAGFKGWTVRVTADRIPALPEGEYYLDSLIGMTVMEQDQVLGKVADIHEAGGTHVLVVGTDQGGELLVPLVKAIVKEVEQTGTVIRVVLPQGLKELAEEHLP